MAAITPPTDGDAPAERELLMEFDRPDLDLADDELADCADDAGPYYEGQEERDGAYGDLGVMT